MTPLQRAFILGTVFLPFITDAGPVAPLAEPVAGIVLTAAQKEQIATLAAQAVAFHLDRPQPNDWTDSRGRGSCAWCSTINLLRWQGLHAQADDLRQNKGGAAGPSDIYPELDRLRIPYAEASPRGDESFLERACATRRGACVVVDGGSHMINLVGLDKDTAYLLGNATKQYVHAKPRAEFMTDWKQAGGWAFTIVGTPPPPKPWIIRKEGAK